MPRIVGDQGGRRVECYSQDSLQNFNKYVLDHKQFCKTLPYSPKISNFQQNIIPQKIPVNRQILASLTSVGAN